MRSNILAAAAVIVLSGAPAVTAQEGNLVVYNPAGEAGEMLINAFTAKHPGITISAISGGVGEIFTRVEAEKANPQGDVVVCASSEAFMSDPTLFSPHDSPEAASFGPDVVGPEKRFYGCSMPLQAFIVNRNLLPEDQWPKTWEDLGKPEYKDKIVLANPSLSGSAYAQLAQILQLYGWETAEKVMGNARFVTSSSTVFQDVARGEIEIGVTGEANIKPLIDEGFPVAAVYPADGTGLRYDASGIIAGGPNPQNAALFLDFLNSKEAHEIVAGTNRRSVRVDVPAPAGLAPTDQIKTFPYDAALAAKNRDENIKHWDELFSR